ncbi:MAG: 2-phospho-L-lactate transferase [Gammaproteobacteria bacterium]|nr:2-phospho-L-lactate transferase [Gammaproteobacteria bacterium]
MTLLALTGGVGGAKLALGFAKVLPPEDVVFVVNTGDDFEHLGLHISPDVDTLTYTLAEVANPIAGWGRKDETWRFMDALERFGGETWFRLGDADLALHLHRRTLLNGGLNLTAATNELAGRLGVKHTILPMSDDPVRTRVLTPDGPLAFQHYFVRDRCEPKAVGFEFAGAETASVNSAIRFESITAIVICPSNPFVSVDPILAVKGMRDALLATGAPIVAVSPIVGGRAIKGPTAKMMRELGVPTTTVAVAEHYAGLVSHFVIDEVDACMQTEVEALGMGTAALQTVMTTLDDRVELARSILALVR